MTAVSFYAFVSNYISASIAPALPIWNLSFPHDPRSIKQLMEFVAVRHLPPSLLGFWVCCIPLSTC